MNIRRPWVKLAMLFSLVAVVAFMVPYTLAYVFDRTDTLVNTFVPNAGAMTQAPVDVQIVKSVINSGKEKIGPEGFSFVLEDTVTGEKLTAVSDEKGKAMFSLRFAAQDVGKDHIYKVYELDEGRAGVTYSEMIYTVVVNVTAVENRPTATVLLDGVETKNCTVRFENIYKAGGEDTPVTGDMGSLGLYLVLMAISAGTILMLYRRRAAR